MKKANIPPAINTTDLPHPPVNRRLTELRDTQAREVPFSPATASENIESMAEIDMGSPQMPRSQTLNPISPPGTDEILRSTEISFMGQPEVEVQPSNPISSPGTEILRSTEIAFTGQPEVEVQPSNPISSPGTEILRSTEIAFTGQPEAEVQPSNPISSPGTEILRSTEIAFMGQPEVEVQPSNPISSPGTEILRNTEIDFRGQPSNSINSPGMDKGLGSTGIDLSERPGEVEAQPTNESSSARSSDSIRADTQLLRPREETLEQGYARSQRVPLTYVEITITVVCLIFGIIAWSINDPLIRKSLPIFASLSPFDAPQDRIPWAEQASIIASTSCAPLYARFSDVYGRRRLLSIALILLIVGQAVCMFTASLSVIIVAKLISGAGGGGVYPLAFVILADIEPLEKRARHTAPWAVVFTTSSMLLPQAGQALIIISMNLWRWLFLIPMIFGAVALLFVLLLPRSSIHPGEKREGHRVDWRGSILILLGMVFLLAAVSWSSQTKTPSDAIQSQAATASRSGAIASVSSLIKSASGVVASAASLATSIQSQILPKPTSFSTTLAQLPTIADGVQFADSTVFVTSTYFITETFTVSGTISGSSTVPDTTSSTVPDTTSSTVPHTTSSTVLDITSSSTPLSPSNLGLTANTNTPSLVTLYFNLSSFDKGSSYALLDACHVPTINSTNSDGSASDDISYNLWEGVLIALFAAGAVFISAFVYEQHGQGEHEATIPLRIFKNKIVSTIFAVEVLFGAVFSGVQNFLPIYFSDLNCDTGSVSGLNSLYPLLGSTLAATIFVMILTRYRLYRLTSLLGAVLMFIGTVTLRISMSLPGTDTHILDGVSLFVACVSVVITFQILALWAQSNCEVDKDLRAVVTGLTQCFFMIGQALGYTITNSIFSNHLADQLALIGVPVSTARLITNQRSIPNWAATPGVFEAYVGGQQLVYHGFLIPCITLAVVLIGGTWIWAKDDSKLHKLDKPDKSDKPDMSEKFDPDMK